MVPLDKHAAAAGWPRPARLSVGVVSAGRVGTAIGQALERAGHVVSGCVAASDESRARARTRLPDSLVASVDSAASVARSAELLVLAVPDTDLADVSARLAGSADAAPSGDWTGKIILHTSGANGVAILAPFAERGAVCLAVHPAMTFTGDAADTDRLASACFGVTAADEVALAIAQSLVLEIGGEPVVIPESSRTLYHAALAHGSNHLVTLVRDAAAALSAALRPQPVSSGAGVGLGDFGQGDLEPLGGTITESEGAPERILAPLLSAALDNALRYGDAALTGPVARGDTEAVAAHMKALAQATPAVADSYRDMALRTAQRCRAPEELIERLQEHSR